MIPETCFSGLLNILSYPIYPFLMTIYESMSKFVKILVRFISYEIADVIMKFFSSHNTTDHT